MSALLRVSQELFTETFPDPDMAEPAMTRVFIKRRVIDYDSDEDGNPPSLPKLRRTDTASTVQLPDSPFSFPAREAFDIDDQPPASVLEISEAVKPTAEVQAVVFTHFVHAKGRKPCEACSSNDAQCYCWPLAPDYHEIRSQRAVNRIVGGGYELEVSPTTGRSHVQGWFMLEKPIAMQTLRKFFADKGCNITFFGKMRGTVAQSIEYCSKDGGYKSYGSQDCVNPHARSGQGARNDIAEFVEACQKGTSMHDMCIQYPEFVLRHSRGVETIRQHVFVDPRLSKRVPRVNIIFYGPTGTGKSTAANQYVGKGSCYIPCSNNTSIFSFETYDGQEFIKMEEFAGPRLGVNSLKDMAGDDVCQLTGRGFSKPGLHNSVVITSNYNPAGWYAASPEDYKALQRRFIIYHCGEREWSKSWVDKETGEVCELKFPNPLIVYKNGSWAAARGPWVLR
jgi:hypothetical protein